MNRKHFFFLGGLLFVAGCAWSLLDGGILSILLSPDYSAAERIALVERYFLAWGPWAPLVYVLVVTIEVIIAPIPGLMLYAPGGVIFGGFYGGLYSLMGNILGAGIAAALMQVFQGRRLERFLERDKIQGIVRQLRNSGVWVILALRINPLTTTDLVSYAAGLAGIPIWKVMLGTGIGMAPLCWAQSYLAEELFESMPWLIYPLLVIALVYLIVAIAVIRRTCARS